jgi:hypothetical protein
MKLDLRDSAALARKIDTLTINTLSMYALLPASYASPFALTGEPHEVVIQASPERYADSDAAGYAAEMSVN